MFICAAARLRVRVHAYVDPAWADEPSIYFGIGGEQH